MAKVCERFRCLAFGVDSLEEFAKTFVVYLKGSTVDGAQRFGRFQFCGEAVGFGDLYCADFHLGRSCCRALCLSLEVCGPCGSSHLSLWAMLDVIGGGWLVG